MKTVLFWYRRDLRLEDNAGLHAAQVYAREHECAVVPVFVFDKTILDKLPEKDDARVTFIHDTITAINEQLSPKGAKNNRMAVVYGNPLEEIPKLVEEYNAQAIFYNEDYEPYARYRDQKMQRWCVQENIHYESHKDQVIFAPGEIVKDDGSFYTVYTPFSNKWLSTFDGRSNLPDNKIDTKELSRNSFISQEIPSLSSMGFEKNTDIEIPDINLDRDLLKNYQSTRDIPGNEEGTSRIGVHLRFGTVSVRIAVRAAIDVSDDTFLKELIWREFFMQLLWYRPDTPTHAFKDKYNTIPWRSTENGDEQADHEFEMWCQGKTGYPIVDAGMRELNLTGYMHNRVRMVCASFLCKHLLINWQRGEQYFAGKLLDYEMASNVGNWQWAAGSGADAAPYFRIFNPYTQHKKFDPDNVYVNRWVPEWETDEYVNEIVDYKQGRERALEVYKKALDTGE